MRLDHEIRNRIRELDESLSKIPRWKVLQVRIEINALRWSLGVDVDVQKQATVKPRRNNGLASKILKTHIPESQRKLYA